MDRPPLSARGRLRVEFRLRGITAETVYRCAREWDMSLSEAGDRLISAGAIALDADSETTDTQAG
ncbi:hypothetical protein RA989_21185 [Mycobacteroides abscessus subsp. massiliense]